MSFGYSIGDAVLLTQLAWKTVQNARKACGEHDELTQEALSLHVVLRRLEQEAEKPESPFNGVQSGDSDKEELQVIIDGCRRVLSVLDQVLTKYNALGEQERSTRKLWQKIKFGNGKIANLAETRAKLTYYTSAMSLFLNMVATGTMGRVEQQMNDAGGDLKEIKVAVNGIAAHLISSSNRHEGSILTAYADDDRAVWKEFRRELLEDGFSSSVIQKHKILIKAYIEELGSRGLFDEEDPNSDVEKQCCDVDSVVEGATAPGGPEIENNPKAPSRPKTEVESPVESTSRPGFDIESNTASHSETESQDRERPIDDDAIPKLDSQPKPETEMRRIWSRNENDRKSQNCPAGKQRIPKKMDKRERDEKATRLFHDIWHNFHDDLELRWIDLFIRPLKSGPRPFLPVGFIEKLCKAHLGLTALNTPAHLSVRKLELWEDMKIMMIRFVDYRKPNYQWKDERSARTGHRVKCVKEYNVNLLSGVKTFTARTGDKCTLC